MCIIVTEPTKQGIKIALKARKAPGIDNIPPPEILKVDLEMYAEILHPLFTNIWGKKTVLEEWEKGLLVKIPKKEYSTQCNNWGGLTLLSVQSKVLNWIVLSRIKVLLKSNYGKNKLAFEAIDRV
jgi:hypothetical protein